MNSTPYICPACIYTRTLGGAGIALHLIVSHSGREPIIEVPDFVPIKPRTVALTPAGVSSQSGLQSARVRLGGPA